MSGKKECRVKYKVSEFRFRPVRGPDIRNLNPPQGFGRIRLSPRLIRPLADFGGT